MGEKFVSSAEARRARLKLKEIGRILAMAHAGVLRQEALRAETQKEQIKNK